MQKNKFWSQDWFAAVAFSLVFLVLTGVFSDAFQSLERSTYDVGVRSRDLAPSEDIAVVAIDDQSISNLGRWPWPRSLQAQLIDKLHEGGAKVIGNTALYLEPEKGGATDTFNSIISELKASPLVQQIPAEVETFGIMLDETAQRSKAVEGIAAAYKDSALAKEYRPAMEALLARLETAAKTGGSADTVLAASLTPAGVVLPMVFQTGRPQGRPDKPLPEYVRRNQLTNVQDRVGARGKGALPPPTISAQVPIAQVGDAAVAIGHLNVTPDVDGAVRYEPLVLQHFDEFYPSLSLMIAAAKLNLKPADIQVNLGEGVTLGGVTIGTTDALRMYTQFYSDQDGKPAFPVDAAYDVIAGKIPLAKYKDKVVLIGTTALGTGDTFATPVSSSTSPVVMLAHAVSSILRQHYFTRPAWAGWLELFVFALLVAYLALLLPRMKAALAAGVTLALVLLLLGTQIGVMASSAIWFKLTVPALFLLAGHAFMTVKKFRITELLKQNTDVENSESNKMLGLAFQGQGQLDMAFEKFRRVQPVDDKLLDLMYNLALDFERKRQFNKAESVYQHIASHNKDFRDVAQKLNRAKKLSETVILGGGGGRSHPGGTMVLDNDATQQIEKPMLGRYQVEKELGKGAMGIVYMGKDPKIGRTVAIKTMALSQEFEPDELVSVKERFFREAETAGRLTHPHIVSIYDAGEEHDLAFIAMEFIKGHDLTKHTKANNLLPMTEVLRLVADAADALDYAHTNGVVHRDIKPANMMLVEATQTIKLMDFGIARIADSSKTKTGMVLGTPSYMSPEQLAGKRVDGRSDLFSLGVTLYQLLTGALPFQADSMATLMFKIANEPHAPAGGLRPDLPPKINVAIDRALHKDMEQRYQRGSELARDLRFILSGLGGPT
ncbi:CHASE2 domain-containing protein [Solimonas sp. K1W22B-7]|uniref:CHASE2 domain-containing serine/threonine-protein kinase n=1 Tax=Solimonas sp. K1W22B-7 TaxID=2303331 RepID=UPI000E3364EB|nr:serine/threonine-protein kinase [Solimonas sp. K1W22B-7]AXQ29661.1 CHASE2 domain-containing protein [Solimonas sp. K1W22B-7]